MSNNGSLIVVLVHGAFADASGFRGLYNELLGEDLSLVAPPNPLRGLSGGDGEYVKCVIDEIDGPVLRPRASTSRSAPTSQATMPRSTPSRSAPSRVLRSPRPHDRSARGCRDQPWLIRRT
jgi:hypothetical protein